MVKLIFTAWTQSLYYLKWEEPGPAICKPFTNQKTLGI